MTSDIKLVERAATLLDTEANALRASHNVDHANPTWDGEPEAKQAHDEMKATAVLLYALAKRLCDWKSCATEPPDSDLTVLLHDENASEPVWPGYLDGTTWRYVDGVEATPSEWTHMPIGPINEKGNSNVNY